MRIPPPPHLPSSHQPPTFLRPPSLHDSWSRRKRFTLLQAKGLPRPRAGGGARPAEVGVIGGVARMAAGATGTKAASRKQGTSTRACISWSRSWWPCRTNAGVVGPARTHFWREQVVLACRTNSGRGPDVHLPATNTRYFHMIQQCVRARKNLSFMIFNIGPSLLATWSPHDYFPRNNLLATVRPFSDLSRLGTTEPSSQKFVWTKGD